ncbi:anticodon-binding protein [Acrocarpospora catenulata]|uniref:anticodon-binding protein n=1 Tax=Acrocarpospora catenulata TaxID=2836182 RepID=UPI001BDB3811|nr:anticodon-binding protein [Acrocarpospora catenulata]
MTPDRLADLLGAVPIPTGSWTDTARYLARATPPPPSPDISEISVRSGGLLVISVTNPGEHVEQILTQGLPDLDTQEWPDHPLTWDNPGFVVRYAHARAMAVQRWADDLGVPWTGFRPEHLDGSHDRAILRVLAELPSRAAARDHGWRAFAERLALAYHDAHEHASAIPVGDQAPAPVHTARRHLAAAVAATLDAISANPLPDRL